MSLAPSRRPSTSSALVPTSWPSTSAMRARWPAGSSVRAGQVTGGRSSVTRVKPTSGRASARRFTASTAAAVSARSDFRNFSRAGVAKNRSRTSTRVPKPSAAGFTADFTPPSTRISCAASVPRGRLVMDSRATAPMEGRASPRKPRVCMASRSSPSSLEVAWRSTARARSSALMPLPSSVTRISRRPPPSTTISMRVAPASRAFSTISFSAAAGRSTTSPAAMRSTRVEGSRRSGMGRLDSEGRGRSL